MFATKIFEAVVKLAVVAACLLLVGSCYQTWEKRVAKQRQEQTGEFRAGLTN